MRKGKQSGELLDFIDPLQENKPKTKTNSRQKLKSKTWFHLFNLI